MAWIELHQSLWTHRKTFILAAELGIDETQAGGHLARLWSWALDNAADGEISGPASVVAFGAGWRGDAAAFVAALVAAGWLDIEDRGAATPAYWLHDWADYAGRLIEQRARNRQRMRTARAENAERTDDTRAMHVRSTERARVGLPNQTVPNQTIPSEDPSDPLGGAAAPAARKPQRKRDDQSALDPGENVVRPTRARKLTEADVDRLRVEFEPKLRDFEGSLAYWLNDQRFRVQADKPAFLERKLREAVDREVQQRAQVVGNRLPGGGRNGHANPAGHPESDPYERAWARMG